MLLLAASHTDIIGSKRWIIFDRPHACSIVYRSSSASDFSHGKPPKIRVAMNGRTILTIWGLFFKSHAWLEKVCKAGNPPVLIGSVLNHISQDSVDPKQRGHLALICEGNTYPALFEECLQPHGFQICREHSSLFVYDHSQSCYKYAKDYEPIYEKYKNDIEKREDALLFTIAGYKSRGLFLRPTSIRRLKGYLSPH
ncbi:hypothetical protein FOXB_16724 [Fusarium oxysporum f. sp. conglutinans Fo5176]|uniref:Uncharacterized protein n=1 Tax=Fusarium oxysporum (strain Fo5176) TaxID=660025 RepID=F9GDJ0_FUSOF|nr:hypothetical protein FOXB_16724 [Fusarium oxysporum f. sp. conglutinans Fo5176]